MNEFLLSHRFFRLLITDNLIFRHCRRYFLIMQWISAVMASQKCIFQFRKKLKLDITPLYYVAKWRELSEVYDLQVVQPFWLQLFVNIPTWSEHKKKPSSKAVEYKLRTRIIFFVKSVQSYIWLTQTANKHKSTMILKWNDKSECCCFFCDNESEHK
jgi:hypothetical protein